MTPAGSVRPPPRLLVAAAAGVLALTTALVVLGALRSGIGTDEPIHVMRLRNLFDTGWYALDWDFGAGAGGDGTPGGSASNVYVYGPAAMLLLHGWGVLWGTESWGQVGTTAAAYQVRHLGVALIGWAGVAATAALGRAVLRSWRWGLVAAAVLTAIPVWTGNAMLNIKDTPVATGHTLVTLGLVLALRTGVAPARLRWARAGCLAAGLALALGTRPGLWPGLLVVLAAAAVGVVVVADDRALARRTLLELGASCLVAAGVLVASYPNLFGAPWRALPRSSEGSSRLLDGGSADRWYLPRHLAEDLPTLLVLFALTGLALVLLPRVAAALRDRRGSLRPEASTLRLLLVAGQATVLPLAAVVAGSDLYHGLRQVLFVLPALAVLTAVGMAWWLDRAPSLSRTPLRLATAAAAAALLLPAADQVTLQPYQSTYVNLAADVLHGWGGPDDDRPSADYWRASLPELVADTPLDGQLLCKTYETDDAGSDTSSGTDTGTVAQRFTNADEQYSTRRSIDCREEPDGPLAPAGLPVDPAQPSSFDAVFIGPVPDNCTPTGRVTRSRHGFDVVVSTLARCTSAPAPLGSVPVRADGSAVGTAEPGDLWLYAVDGWLQWPGRDVLTTPVDDAVLGFAAAPACAPSGCTLVLTGGGPADLTARVDGTAVPVSRRDGALRLPVTAAAAGHDVRVDLERRSGGPLDVRMTGLALVPRTTPKITPAGGVSP